jgi:hypothetical protein
MTNSTSLLEEFKQTTNDNRDLDDKFAPLYANGLTLGCNNGK